MIIIRKHGENEIYKKQKDETTTHHWHNKSSNLSTNWFIIDFGFSNYNDQTNYSSSEAQSFAPGTSKESLQYKNLEIPEHKYLALYAKAKYGPTCGEFKIWIWTGIE